MTLRIRFTSLDFVSLRASRAALVLLALGGCAMDSTLMSVLPDDEPGTSSSNTHTRPPGVGPHQPNPRNDSPWANLNPGDLPEVYFAIAYSDYPYGYYGCAYCDADAEWWYPYGDVKYAVIDLRGQVVWEVPGLGANTAFEHLDLAPGGPGEFLVTARPWYTYDDELDADGWYASTNWEAYRMNAVAMTGSRVAHFDLDRWVTHIDAADTDVDVGPAYGTLHLGMFPSEPERALFLGADTYDCTRTPNGVRDLKAVHLSSPDEGAISYATASFLPDPAQHYWGWDFEAAADENGDPVALFGLTPWDCSALVGDAAVAMWSPTDGIKWTAEVGTGNDTWPLTASFDPREGGGALTFGWNTTSYLQEWRVVDEDGTRRGEFGDNAYNYRPGPLLEHASDTFMAVGTRNSDGYDEIQIFSGGRKVWTIDELRFGVGRQNASIIDLTMITPP